MIEYTLIDEQRGIDGNGNEVNLAGTIRLINGEKIQVFESIDDRDEYISNMPKPFYLDDYKQQVNDAHTQLYNNLWLSLGYMSEAEITTWSNTLKKDALSVAWKAEAKAVLSWFCETTIIVYKYLDDVTEQTAQPVETFLQTLPAFQV